MINNNIRPQIMKRTMAKDFETHEKERKEMIAKMTPSERSIIKIHFEEIRINDK